jgi:hypothetical protein
MQVAFVRSICEVAPEVSDELAQIAPDEALYAATVGVEHSTWSRVLIDAEYADSPGREAAERLVASIRTWAKRYFLDAEWILRAATWSLTLSRRSGLPVRLRTTMSIWSAPGSARDWNFLVEGYRGAVAVTEFREEQLRAFRVALDTHIEAAVAGMEDDPDLVRSTAATAATLKNLRRAALWQARGEASVRTERKQLKTVLRRIALTPRPGLV